MKFLKALKLVSKYGNLVETLVSALTKALDNEPNPGKITKSEITQILIDLLPAVVQVIGVDRVTD